MVGHGIAGVRHDAGADAVGAGRGLLDRVRHEDVIDLPPLAAELVGPAGPEGAGVEVPGLAGLDQVAEDVVAAANPAHRRLAAVVVEVADHHHVLAPTEQVEVVATHNRRLGDALGVPLVAAALRHEVYDIQMHVSAGGGERHAHALADTGVFFGVGVVEFLVIRLAAGDLADHVAQGTLREHRDVLPREAVLRVADRHVWIVHALGLAEQELKKQADRQAADLKKETELALAKAKQERVDALAKQEAQLEKQRQLEMAKAEHELKKQVEGEAANVKRETELALAKAEKQRDDAWAKQEAELEKQRQLEVAKAEQELNERAERETAKLEKEKELALAEAALAHKAELAAQKSALEEESARVLSDKEQAFTRKLALQKKLLAEVAEEIGS